MANAHVLLAKRCMMSHDSPSDIATVVFTDVVGSSRLWNAAPEEMHTALMKLEKYIFGVCVRNNGTVIKTIGDATMMAFATLQDALRVAKTVQQHLACKPIQVGESKLVLRIGIAVGPVKRHTMRVGTHDLIHVLPDLFGPSVNLASRAESSVSVPGGIAVGILKSDPNAASYRAMLLNHTPPFTHCTRLTKGSKRPRRSNRLLHSTEVVKGFNKSDVDFLCMQ